MTGVPHGQLPRARLMALLAGIAAASAGCDRPAADPPAGVTVVRGGPGPSPVQTAPAAAPERAAPTPRLQDAATPRFAPRADLLAQIAEDDTLRPLPAEMIQPRSAATQPHRASWEAELRGRRLEDTATAADGGQR